MDQYTEMWQYSIENNEAFWREKVFSPPPFFTMKCIFDSVCN